MKKNNNSLETEVTYDLIEVCYLIICFSRTSIAQQFLRIPGPSQTQMNSHVETSIHHKLTSLSRNTFI